VNHLTRELAPVTDAAWAQIDAEATRSLTHFLAARRIVDFEGPLGWEHSAVDLGRVDALGASPHPEVDAARRLLLPLVELRSAFTLARSELDAADRGASDLDLNPVIDAARSAALAEDGAVFHGFGEASIRGIAATSPHDVIPITDEYDRYPEHVANAVAVLRAADIAGPYAIALGQKCYTGVIETSERGGYPVLEHLRQILGGPVIWAPAVQGAIVISQRGGDFELTVGEDYSIGYRSHDVSDVHFYIEESMTFKNNTPQAAVHLAFL
jgi:uncharacterized linocin/CFP29 family protein